MGDVGYPAYASSCYENGYLGRRRLVGFANPSRWRRRQVTRIRVPRRWTVPLQTCYGLGSSGTVRHSRVEQANKEPERQVGSARGREVRAARPLHRVTRPCPPHLPHSSLPHQFPSFPHNHPWLAVFKYQVIHYHTLNVCILDIHQQDSLLS